MVYGVNVLSNEDFSKIVEMLEGEYDEEMWPKCLENVNFTG